MKKYINIFAIACLFVFLGHFFLFEYQGFLTPIAFLVIIGVVIKKLKDEESSWQLLLILFICHHFVLGENRGGLFSYVTLIFGIAYLVKFGRNARKKDSPLINMMFVVILFNVFLGYVATGFRAADQIVYGSILLCSTFSMFKLFSGAEITEGKLKDFMVVTGGMIIYLGVVTLNQRFSFINLDFYTAFLPPSNRNLGEFGEILPAAQDDLLTLASEFVRPMGTFWHWELTGEYGLLGFALFFPFFFSQGKPFSSGFVLAASLAGAFIVINTLNRGPLYLLPVIFLLGIVLIRFLDERKMSRLFLLLPALLLIPVVFFWDVVESTGLYRRLFEELAFIDASTPNTRLSLWAPTLAKLMETPIAGMGMRTGPTMEVQFIGFAPHSLYFALPFYYGWIGGGAFVLFVVATSFRLLRAVASKTVSSYLRFSSLGLLLLWVAFLGDEYKIDMLRNAQYQHVVWSLLGFSWGIVKTTRASSEPNLQSAT